MALRTQTLNRGNIVTPICQYWPLAAEVGFTRGGEMPIVVVASEGQGGDPSNDYSCLTPQLSGLDTKEENVIQLLTLACIMVLACVLVLASVSGRLLSI